MSNKKLILAEKFLGLADKISNEGTLDIEDSLKAYFSKQEILQWYADSNILKVLLEHDKFIKKLGSTLTENPFPASLSNLISNEQDRINIEIACTEHLLETHSEIEQALCNKAKIITIRDAAVDFNAINPDLVVEIIRDQTEAFLTEKGGFVVRMKDKKHLLEGIRSLKNSGSYSHLFR